MSAIDMILFDMTNRSLVRSLRKSLMYPSCLLSYDYVHYLQSNDWKRTDEWKMFKNRNWFPLKINQQPFDTAMRKCWPSVNGILIKSWWRGPESESHNIVHEGYISRLACTELSICRVCLGRQWRKFAVEACSWVVLNGILVISTGLVVNQWLHTRILFDINNNGFFCAHVTQYWGLTGGGTGGGQVKRGIMCKKESKIDIGLAIEKVDSGRNVTFLTQIIIYLWFSKYEQDVRYPAFGTRAMLETILAISLVASCMKTYCPPNLDWILAWVNDLFEYKQKGVNGA